MTRTTEGEKMSAWYVGKTGNHQGLVIEEGTGRTVAVAYNKADAPLLAAAPDMLSALKAAEKWAMLTQTDSVPWLDDATAAITAAIGPDR